MLFVNSFPSFHADVPGVESGRLAGCSGVPTRLVPDKFTLAIEIAWFAFGKGKWKEFSFNAIQYKLVLK